MEKDNIKFEYPTEWIIRDFPGYYVLLSEPPKEEMSVMTTFDIVIEEDTENLNEFCKEYENRMSNHTQFRSFKIKEKRKIKIKRQRLVLGGKQTLVCYRTVHS